MGWLIPYERPSLKCWREMESDDTIRTEKSREVKVEDIGIWEL